LKLDKNKVFWWSPQPLWGLKIFQKENVGDLLGPLLAQKILDTRALNIGDIQKNKLLTIGSVMHFANTGDTTWGTGVNGKVDESLHKFTNLDVRAVRGHLTAEFLKKRGIDSPQIFGDPGILVSDFWPRSEVVEKGKVVYIPHMREKERYQAGMKTLSPLVSLQHFVKEIQTAEKVVSSSLHGVIIAESYGVPACLYESKSGETPFKYEDYYSGTGRSSFRMFDDISEAKRHEPDVPDLSAVKVKLLSAFPWDLWGQA
jgi:pyruvyltransferase